MTGEEEKKMNILVFNFLLKIRSATYQLKTLTYVARVKLLIRAISTLSCVEEQILFYSLSSNVKGTE